MGQNGIIIWKNPLILNVYYSRYYVLGGRLPTGWGIPARSFKEWGLFLAAMGSLAPVLSRAGKLKGGKRFQRGLMPMKRLKRSLEIAFSVYHVCLGMGGNSVIYSLGSLDHSFALHSNTGEPIQALCKSIWRLL